MNLEKNTTPDTPFKSSGRFSRLSYLAWTFLSGIIFNAVYMAIAMCAFMFIGVSVGIDPNTEPTMSTSFLVIFSLVILILGLVYLVYMFIFTIRRLHDCNRSGWLSILMLIPLVNLFFLLYVCMAKGNEGENRYGEPRPTKEWEKVMGILYLVLIPLMMIFVFGILAAIAIPAYNDYVERAKQAQYEIEQNIQLQNDATSF